jgi:hypothetical protein
MSNRSNTYVISCRNDFPPVDKYTIDVYADYSALPLNLCDLRYDTIYAKSKDTLIFICRDTDPAGAMIKFWTNYMYREASND